jgi:hypothetical protein
MSVVSSQHYVLWSAADAVDVRSTLLLDRRVCLADSFEACLHVTLRKMDTVVVVG